MDRGAALLVALLCLWPLRDSLISGALPGAGPDVISTVWGMWWLQKSWVAAGWTDLVNYPDGAIGSVLSPSTALAWALLEPLFGAGRALALVSAATMAGFCLSCGWLARRLGGPFWVGALVPLVPRYLPFGVGEASVVAIADLPLPLGLIALHALRQQPGWRPALAAAACMAGMAVENPYLAPVLPGLALLALIVDLSRRQPVRHLLGALLGGSAGVLAIAALFSGSASPDYPREVAGQLYALGPLSLEVVDLPWARATPAELLLPGPVSWTLHARAGESASGGRYLGLSALLLGASALFTCRRAAAPALLFALLGLSLSLGSLVGGLPGPFLLLNALMDRVARPLTQPLRFLALCLVGLSAAAALSVAALRQRWPARADALSAGLAALLLLDALLLGGPSLRLPTTPLPEGSCLSGLDGPTLAWPADARDAEQGPSQLLQMVHGQASPQTGIASWRQHGRRSLDLLRGAGFVEGAPAREGRVQLQRISSLGYRHLLVDSDPQAVSWLQAAGARPTSACGAYTLLRLP